MAQIPQKLADYAVYIAQSNTQLGVADVTLPSFESMSTETTGGGILGGIEVPTPGMFGPQQLGLAFNTINPDAFDLMNGKVIKVEMFASQQSWNTAQAQIVNEGLKIVAWGLAKNLELGTLTRNDSTGTNFEMEITYIKIMSGGRDLLELDKTNYKYKIKGVDVMIDIRKNLGMA